MVLVKERPEFAETSLPHGRYDIITKDLMRVFAEQILRFLTRNHKLQFIEHVESEFTTVDVRRMDSLAKVDFDGQAALVHCEFQVGDSTHLEMARRNVGYLGRCHEQHGLPILSHVIYLRPNAGRNDPGLYVHDVSGYRYIVEYKVIRLIELDGESVFDGQHTGLIPFAPLMRPPAGVEGIQWAHQCNRATKALSLDPQIRSNLLVAQWVLSGLVHDQQTISNFISEDIMQESSVYRYIIERGARENAIELLYDVLNVRFDAGAVELVKPALEDIDDLQRLKQLHHAALQAQSLEAFKRTLEANG